MGMFDDLECHPSLLPDDLPEHSGFQTKSFPEPSMDKYRITEEGDLEILRYDLEETGVMIKIAGVEWPERRRINERWEKVQDYHGDIYFYASVPQPGHHYSWYEFNARFTDGKLSRLTPIPPYTKWYPPKLIEEDLPDDDD